MNYSLVTDQTLKQAAADIAATKECGLDTETYGVKWNDRMFALQISTEQNVWYYNFHDYTKNWHEPSVASVFQLDVAEVMESLKEAFNDPEKIWYIHNAKFDLRRLAIDGAYLHGGVHCTQMCERFLYNQYQSYSLAGCLARRKRAKDDAVDAYISEHKLWSWEDVPGKKKRNKLKFYDQVPFDIMFKYGCIDGEEVRFLGGDQRAKLVGEEYYENDLKFEKVCYSMEESGMVVRQDYAKGGLEYERDKQREVEEKLSALSPEPFRGGRNWLKATFDHHGVEYAINTKTGNPIFDKKALGEIDHPVAELIRQHRKHDKYAGTYYQTYATQEVVHAFIKPYGTDTGRLSYAEPNLQNVPKEKKLADSEPFQVRGCFAPREDHCFIMVDFDQQEFRLLLDYAGEADLIRRINEHGEDVHDATAEMVGVERDPAKTLNFGLLYGMGEAKLAQALGLPTYWDYNARGEKVLRSREARELKAQYFGRLPRVQSVIKQMIRTAEVRKYVTTWVGRKLHFPYREMCYKAPNHIIQGGCGDIARMAMVPCHELLVQTASSRMLLQVHDELLFEVHKNELDVVPELVKIMENTYRPFNGMRLTCGVDHSWKSWGKRDVVEGLPVC